MVSYLLVHGGNMSTDSWNRLVGRNVYPPGGRLGGKVWDPVVPILEAHNHSVLAPTLEDEHRSNLTDHIQQICTLIVEHYLLKIVLVGHSYGGMVITGVAARMPDRVGQLVYVDAALPDPGQSLFDLFAYGGSDSLSFQGLEAAAPYVQKLQFDPALIELIPKTYVLCTESEFAPVTRVAKKKIAVAGTGWKYVELPTSHVPMATMTDRFAELLLETGV